MGRIDKSVFISYRRTNFYTALAVYQNLSQHGFDVFMDYQGQEGGNFSEVSLENIKKRAHFLVIISPSAIEAYQESENSLRQEIEVAIDSKRNIIPLVMEGFDSRNPSVQKAFSEKLAALKGFGGLRLYSEYFFAGLEKLRERCVNTSVVDTFTAPFSAPVAEKSALEKEAAASAPPVQMKELVTEEWFERGVAFAQHEVWADAIHAFTEALRARPAYAEAYYRRGWTRRNEGDFEGAVSDFEQTLRYRPEFSNAYLGRGIVYRDEGNFQRAIADFNQALKINPDHADAYYQRGKTYGEKGDMKRAVADYDEAIRIQPDFAEAYNDRGIERYNQNNFEGAYQDYDEAIRIQPDYADAYNSRGLVHGIQGNLEGAIADFSQALFIQPDYAAAYYNRAAIWQQKKAYAAAITDYYKYLNLSKGMLYGNQAKVKQIIRDLKKKIAEG